MKAVTIKCPNAEHCGRQHALFWLVDSTGRKGLSYRCHRVWRTRHTGISPDDGVERVEHYFGKATLPFDEEGMNKQELKSLPEVWSKDWKKKQQDKLQDKITL